MQDPGPARPTVDVEVVGTRGAAKGELRQEVAGDWREWELSGPVQGEVARLDLRGGRGSPPARAVYHGAE